MTQPDKSSETSATDKPIKKGLQLSFASKLGITLCLLFTLTAIAYIYIDFSSKIPTAKWRDRSIELPWETDGFTIERISTYWQDSSNHERMKLRAAYYPISTIELGAINSKGVLMVDILNSQQVKVGDTVTLHFTPEGFVPIDNENMQAQGKKAIFHIYDGLKTKEDFTLYNIDHNADLWCVEVNYRLEGDKETKKLHRHSIHPVTEAQD